MTEALIGYGSEFWLDDDTNVLTELGEILSVTPPNPQVDDVDAFVVFFDSLGGGNAILHAAFVSG